MQSTWGGDRSPEIIEEGWVLGSWQTLLSSVQVCSIDSHFFGLFARDTSITLTHIWWVYHYFSFPTKTTDKFLNFFSFKLMLSSCYFSFNSFEYQRGWRSVIKMSWMVKDKRPKGFGWLIVEHKPKIWSAYKWLGGLIDAYKKGGNSVMKLSSTRTKPALQKWAHSLEGH